MSYHLAMRSLQLSGSTTAVGTFVDCIEHSLAGEHPASMLQKQMQISESYKPTFTAVADSLSQLLAVDLNPVGHVLRLASNETTYRRTWDFYNERGNVVSKFEFSGTSYFDEVPLRRVDLQTIRNERKIVSDSHEKILSSFHDVLSRQLRNCQDLVSRSRRLEDSRVSAVARIFGMGQLISEFCELFEEFPAANVSTACKLLSVHPRLVERRMKELGITAVKLKRACMLSLATHQILWSDRNLNEIAIACGYTHGAHLSNAFVVATGGMTPSFIRGLVKY